MHVLRRAHQPPAGAGRDGDPVTMQRAMCAQHAGGAPKSAAAVTGHHLVTHPNALDGPPGSIRHRDQRALDQALRVIPHHHQIPPLLGQQLKPAVLGVVGVLVLVDQHVAEAGGVDVLHLLEELEQVHGAEQQVVEVHGVHAVKLALVLAVDIRDGLLEERFNDPAVGVGVAELVLGVGDLGLDGGRRESLGIEAQVVEAALDQSPGVGLVIDRELARVAEPVGVRSQHSGAGGVESHDPHGPDAPADQVAPPGRAFPGPPCW